MKKAEPAFHFDDPAVVGKVVLIGIKYFGPDGEETGRAQCWGRIVAFNMREGLRVELAGSNKVHAFPPFEDALRAAAPGTYELDSTGEMVDDPDFLYTIRSHRPAS